MASSNQYIEFNLTQCISEIITYSTLALINNTNLTFLDLNKKTISLTLKPEIDILLAMGVSIKWERNNLHIPMCALDHHVQNYPGSEREEER